MRTCWRSIRGTSPRTSTWASCCSPPARSIAGSPTSMPSRSSARIACRSPSTRSKPASTRATSRGWIAISTACAATSSTREDEDGSRRLPRVAALPASVLRRRAVARAASFAGVRRAGAEGLRRRASACPSSAGPGRLRVGYLSGDLRNHVMGKMMWQAIAQHDRAAFEIFFYSTSAPSATSGRSDSRAWRRASTSSRALDDATAAGASPADDLDLLVDLSTHTKGSRPGILATKPARVQMTHVASAGTVGLSQIDWKLTDHRCDLPESQEFMIERLIAMDGCVYPYRHVDAGADASVSSRAARHRTAMRRSSARSSIRSSCRAAVFACGVTCWSASRRRCSRSRRPIPRCARATCASRMRPASHESRLLFVPQGRNDEENQARYRDRRLRARHDAVRRGQRHHRGARHERARRHACRQAPRRAYERIRSSRASASARRSRIRAASMWTSPSASRRTPRFATRSSATSPQASRKSPLTDMPSHTRNLEAAYRDRRRSSRATDG